MKYGGCGTPLWGVLFNKYNDNTNIIIPNFIETVDAVLDETPAASRLVYVVELDRFYTMHL